MDCDLPPPPETGPGGLVISKVHIDQEQEIVVHHCLAPVEPDRALYRYDIDLECLVFERDRTDQELAEAHASWLEAMARWRKSGGIHRVVGPVITTAKVKFADGRIGEADWNGSKWRWLGIFTPS